MLNQDFYPTPKSVIKKMLAPYLDNLENRKILEPSAGKGDIVDYIIENHLQYRHKEIFIKCCEYDPDLIATLQGKKYQVVSSDFLKYVPSHYFDLIVMNPPFANGVDHLLHAWEILQSGDIVCLLNAETIRNPHTEKRKLLKRIIEDNNGTVEFIGSVFSVAERKTDVDVALVQLHKEPESDSFFAKPVNRERTESVRPDAKNEIAIKDDLGAMIQAFEAAKRSFASVWKSRAEVENYLSPIGGLTSHYDSSSRMDFLSYACEIKNPIDAYNFFVEEMRKNAWNTVFNRVGVQERVTEKVRKDFEKLRTENGFDFTKENVEALLDGLVLNKGKIMQDCINEAFDLMTAYHKENRIHIEGWKTNDRWMVNRKVILPYMVETRWDGRGFKTRYGYTDASRILDDIDKAMCFLTGKGFDSRDDNGKRTFLRIADAIEIAQNSESEFFFLKSHLKGTLHLTFKDENLWKRFNAAACEGKNWLPGKK